MTDLIIKKDQYDTKITINNNILTKTLSKQFKFTVDSLEKKFIEVAKKDKKLYRNIGDKEAVNVNTLLTEFEKLIKNHK